MTRSPRRGEGCRERDQGPVTLAWLCRDSPFVAICAVQDGRSFDSPAEPTLKVMRRAELFQTITCLSLQDEVKVSCRLFAWNQDGKIS